MAAYGGTVKKHEEDSMLILMTEMKKLMSKACFAGKARKPAAKYWLYPATYRGDRICRGACFGTETVKPLLFHVLGPDGTHLGSCGCVAWPLQLQSARVGLFVLASPSPGVRCLVGSLPCLCGLFVLASPSLGV